MRNLKRFYAVVIAIVMLVSMIAPAMVFAATPSDYAADAKALYEMGLYKGLDPNKMVLDLDSTLNRETAATMVLRLFGLEEEALKMDAKEAQDILVKKFPKDGAKVSVWAARQVAYAVDAEIIKGFPDGTFQPQGLLTGTQYSVLVMKLLGYSDWTFETVAKKFGEVAKLDAADQAAFASNSAIKKSILTGMSRKALDCMPEGAAITLAQQLVNDGVLDVAKATEAGVSGLVAATVKPLVSPTPVVTTAPTTSSVPGVVYGTVNVTAAMTTATSVARGQALLEVGKVTITATQDSNINGIKIKRSGLSADTDISSVTVWDGSSRLNTPAIFSNNVADISFSNTVAVKSGESKILSVKMNVATGSTVGAQVVLSLDDNTFIKTTATVNGTFPMVSGSMTVTSVSLGNMTVTNAGDAPTNLANIDVANDIRLGKIKVVSGNEALKISQVTFSQAGSVADADVTSLKLYNGATQVGSTVSLVNRKATFTFSPALDLALGGTLFLELKGNVVSGSGRTVRMDVDNENDIQAVGVTYGTNIVGTLNDGVSNVSSLTASSLTIRSGTILFAKDQTSPAAGNIGATVTDQKFVILNLQAVGEPVSITKMMVAASTTSGNLYDLTNLKITVNGSIAAQVQNAFGTSSNVLTSPQNITLTNPIKINPGTPAVVVISANLTAAAAGNVYALGLGVGTSALTYTTQISGKTDQPTNVASAVMGSNMTVGSVSVNATVVPMSNDNVFSSQPNIIIGKFKLNHNLTEDINISNIYVNTTFVGGTPVQLADIRNLRATNESGTLISDQISSPLANQTLTFASPITVKANTDAYVNIVADLATTVRIGGIYVGLNNGSSVGGTATTTANGTSVTFGSVAGTLTKTVSVAGATVTVARSAAADLSATKNIQRGQKDVKLGAYTFTNAGPEDATVKKMVLTPDSGSPEFATVTFDAVTAIGGGATVVLNIDGTDQTITGLTVGTAAAAATQARTILNGLSAVTTYYTVGGTGADVTLVAKTNGNRNDVTYVSKTATTGNPTIAIQQGTYDAGTVEVSRLTIANAATGSGTITFTLNGTTYVTPATTIDTAANIAALFRASAALKATVGANWIVSGSGAYVEFTATTSGTKTDAAYTSTTATFAGGPDVPVASTVTQGVNSAVAGNQFINNIRIVNGNDTSKVYASIGTLNGSTNVSLSTPFDISSTAGVNTAEVLVIGDVTNDATINNTYAIRLGDNSTLNDVEYATKVTGTTAYITSQWLGSATGPAAAIFTVRPSKVSLVRKAMANTNPTAGNGIEIGRFTATNSGSVAVKLTTLGLIEKLKSTGGLTTRGVTDATLTIMAVDDGTILATIASPAFTAGAQAIPLSTNNLTLSAGQSRDVTIILAAKGTGATTGDATMLQADKATTLYSTSDGTFTVQTCDDSATLDSVSYK